MLGRLTGAALATAYASSDVFLYPSTTEGWGATCLEAQASGLPVVATASSGITAVVEHGVGGLLVAPGDVEAMADAVEGLVIDSAARVAMGARARRHAARFDWAASGELMLQSYQRHARAVPPRLEGGAADARTPQTQAAAAVAEAEAAAVAEAEAVASAAVASAAVTTTVASCAEGEASLPNSTARPAEP